MQKHDIAGVKSRLTRIFTANKGAALPAVLMVMLVIMALSGGVISLVTSQTKEEAYYENNITALHAAEAGLNQFLWSLNKYGSTPLEFEKVFQYPESKSVAAFRLDGINDNGYIKIVKSTAWMIADPSVKRSVTATYTKRGFAQYIYFSDSEATKDNKIWWTSNDVCYGPYHTNETLRINGSPVFWGKATSVGGIEYESSTTNNPQFNGGYQQVSEPLPMPSDNNELKYYGQSSDGYYFTGITRIMLNTDGTMNVINRDTDLGKMALPKNGVIYVDNMTGSSENSIFDKENGNVFISGVLDGRLTVGAKNDIFITGYNPTKSTYSESTATNGLTYKDTKITMTMVGGKPVLDDNDDLIGTENGDMLGLISYRNIAVLTEGWFGDGNGAKDTSRKNFSIYAAMLAIHGSFGNSKQMYSSGSSLPAGGGVLTVRGSIAQEVRGPVGLISGGKITSGYQKDYAHDPRMIYDQPPYFLDPEGSGWEITDWTEG